MKNGNVFLNIDFGFDFCIIHDGTLKQFENFHVRMLNSLGIYGDYSSELDTVYRYDLDGNLISKTKINSGNHYVHYPDILDYGFFYNNKIYSLKAEGIYDYNLQRLQDFEKITYEYETTNYSLKYSSGFLYFDFKDYSQPLMYKVDTSKIYLCEDNIYIIYSNSYTKISYNKN